MSTLVPVATLSPATGTWAKTVPMGDWLAEVTATATSPTSVMAFSASACGRLTTDGTATFVIVGGACPFDTESAIVVPFATDEPLGGDWAMT